MTLPWNHSELPRQTLAVERVMGVPMVRKTGNAQGHQMRTVIWEPCFANPKWLQLCGMRHLLLAYDPRLSLGGMSYPCYCYQSSNV